MNEVFEKEWKLYRENGDKSPFEAEKPKAKGKFDKDVKVGEIRIFADMTRPFDPALRALARETAASLGIPVKEGVYLADTGPSYETPAEYKFYRIAGADAVGMSTVPEVITARHMGIPVFGMSVITNEAHDDYSETYENKGEDVIVAADKAAGRMSALFSAMIERL